MMYSDKLVVCIKSRNGKVLREHGDTVYVPYGEEYSIYVKNLNSVRASVSIEIDGKNIFSDKSSLVVSPNSDAFVERFVSNNAQGNRFKFIEKTGAISEHRGDKAEDGLIRIAFRYEKPIPKYVAPFPTEVHHHHHHNTPNWGQIYGGRAGGPFIGSTSSDDYVTKFADSQGASKSPLRASGMQLNSVKGAMLSDRRITDGISAQAFTASANALNVDAPMASAQAASLNEKGITVAGTVSNQAFMTVASFQLEAEEHVMVLRMLGELGQNKVSEPVVVQRKITCDTCGTINKGTMKFCGGCGTAIGSGLITA
jgi:hypothetical protein